MSHPSRTECYEYLKEYGTPAHVVGHCKSVAAVAYKLGKALNEAGGTRAADFDDIKIRRFMKHEGAHGSFYAQDHENELPDYPERPFDLELVLSSGLLHDMARVMEDHGGVCADFCREKGFYQEEKIIRVHMQYQFTNDAYHLTEADLIGLGDRLTLEDHYAGLDVRMEYIIRKAERHGHKHARESILRKKEETRKILNDIEKRIGCTIDELMADIDYENTEI